MPGLTDFFSVYHLTNPGLNASLNENRVIRAFKRRKNDNSFVPNGPIYGKDSLHLYTYDQYSPHDDECIDIAIKASYRQIYGIILIIVYIML